MENTIEVKKLKREKLTQKNLAKINKNSHKMHGINTMGSRVCGGTVTSLVSVFFPPGPGAKFSVCICNNWTLYALQSVRCAGVTLYTDQR